MLRSETMQLLVLPLLGAAVPTYQSLTEFVGANADPSDVVNLQCGKPDQNVEWFYQPGMDPATTLLTEYSHGGWGTIKCTGQCNETTLDQDLSPSRMNSTGGCWSTGVAVTDHACVAAKQAGIAPGEQFAYQILPKFEKEFPGCTDNGVSGRTSTRSNSWRIVPQEKVGDNSGVEGPEGDWPDVFTWDNCTWSPSNTPEERGYFAEYDSALAYFEMRCSVECNQEHVPPPTYRNGEIREAKGWEARGCPDIAVNFHVPYCLAASMLEIPPMTTFLVKIEKQVGEHIHLDNCTRSGITLASGSSEESTRWRVVAVEGPPPTPVPSPAPTPAPVPSTAPTPAPSSETSGAYLSQSWLLVLACLSKCILACIGGGLSRT